MCKMCDENDDKMESCQDCGVLICFDVQSADDVIRPAYVTASGDLFCNRCGTRYDREEERMADEEADYYPDPYPFP